MIWILVALTLLSLLLVSDIARMRGRLSALPVLVPSDQPVSPEHQFFTAPGVVLSDATRRAASARARAEGLEVLDLVPADLPALAAMSLAQVVDPRHYRGDRFGRGHTALHAMLVSTDVATRARVVAPADEVDFVRLAGQLRPYAGGRAELAIAPDARARPLPDARRLAVVRALIGGATPVVIVVPLAFCALIGLGFWLAPWWAAAALAAWHLQPLLAIAGTSVRSPDIAVVTLLRAPLELLVVARTLLGRWRPAGEVDPVESRRATYDQLLAADPARRWEPRRATCPLCDAGDLVVHLRVPDRLQHKPGRFTLERCRGCGHIFQNPRLSLEGLDFYYKDFYDGLGERTMDFVFGFQARPYRLRARMVGDQATPRRWLDVGAGHGHFCSAARDELPQTRFDGLDLSESIEEAQRRGWIDTAHRGLFPDLAPGFAGTYDAVSMSHYLEHTLDPRRELAAARQALAADGHLFIEVPDPEFGLGRVLGSFWLPWFQPQHLNLISIGNLDRLLREHGFEPVTWHRGTAHQRVDFFFAAWLILGRLGPTARFPWRKKSSLAAAWHSAVWTLGSPLLLLGYLADSIAAPIIRRRQHSNTYRVVARRLATAPAAAAEAAAA